MKFATRRRVSPAITIIPMIDILTILLIFFIVTTTFKKSQRQVQIVLPKVKGKVDAPSATTQPVELAIQKDGQIFLDNQPVALDDLGEKVKTFEAQGRKPTLKADTDSASGRMFEVLDALQTAGVKEMPAIVRERKK